MADEENTAPPKHVYKQLRYFISSVNTFVGHAIVEAIRNDHVNDVDPHIIVGIYKFSNTFFM
jgi:hypothetical protein